jgi:hypothetical protein
MRRLLAALLVLPLAIPCRAADDAKPNTLTPKEIAEGWILLFDGETTLGWASNKYLKAEKGSLVFGEKGIPMPTTGFLAYEISFDYRPMRRGDQELVRKLLWMECSFMSKPEPDLPVPEGEEWYTFHFVSPDYQASIRSKEKVLKKWKVKFPYSSKEIPNWNVPEDARMSIRNVKLKPLKMKPIFNGKDLTGWKEFPGKKSQFTVTKEGWLSIKDGPGDLQTTGQWADFALQLECRTNGDNLNSGVFFRCIPGEYQNGYEAQIQNQRAKEPKMYTVEEYDSETHKLADKKKVENWSQDYGTGAVYRRVPARRAMAKDREWFTMTVVAHGRHIATWVNGIQMVDWTDNRPENDNARNGCRLKKGPISLQGHDPTTGLYFRNIRIAE